jgi:hypothetical protein
VAPERTSIRKFCSTTKSVPAWPALVNQINPHSGPRKKAAGDREESPPSRVKRFPRIDRAATENVSASAVLRSNSPQPLCPMVPSSLPSDEQFCPQTLAMPSAARHSNPDGSEAPTASGVQTSGDPFFPTVLVARCPSAADAITCESVDAARRSAARRYTSNSARIALIHLDRLSRPQVGSGDASHSLRPSRESALHPGSVGLATIHPAPARHPTPLKDHSDRFDSV